MTGKVLIRFDPDTGTVERYELVQRTTLRMDSGSVRGVLAEQQVTIRLFITQEVTGPAEGGTGVTVTFDSIAVVDPPPAEALAAQLRSLRGLTERLVMDEQMRVVHAEYPTAGPGIGKQLGHSVRSMIVPLPADSVRVGDVWTESVDLPLEHVPGSSQDVRVTTRLVLQEVRITRGDTIVVCDVATTMPEDPITFTLEGEQATMRMAGTLSGEHEFSLKRGMPRAGVMAGVVRITIRPTTPDSGELTLVVDQHTQLRTLGGP